MGGMVPGAGMRPMNQHSLGRGVHGHGHRRESGKITCCILIKDMPKHSRSDLVLTDDISDAFLSPEAFRATQAVEFIAEHLRNEDEYVQVRGPVC